MLRIFGPSLPLVLGWRLDGRPVLNDQFQSEQIGELQEALDCETPRVGFNLGKAVLADGQFGGKCSLRELGNLSARRQDPPELGGMSQDLFHGGRCIGNDDKFNISVIAIKLQYRFGR